LAAFADNTPLVGLRAAWFVRLPGKSPIPECSGNESMTFPEPRPAGHAQNVGYGHFFRPQTAIVKN
jgi:hypothetical protein